MVDDWARSSCCIKRRHRLAVTDGGCPAPKVLPLLAILPGNLPSCQQLPSFTCLSSLALALRRYGLAEQAAGQSRIAFSSQPIPRLVRSAQVYIFAHSPRRPITLLVPRFSDGPSKTP